MLLVLLLCIIKVFKSKRKSFFNQSTFSDKSEFFYFVYQYRLYYKEYFVSKKLIKIGLKTEFDFNAFSIWNLP